jgi:hypothetical protein
LTEASLYKKTLLCCLGCAAIDTLLNITLSADREELSNPLPSSGILGGSVSFSLGELNTHNKHIGLQLLYFGINSVVGRELSSAIKENEANVDGERHGTTFQINTIMSYLWGRIQTHSI